MQKYYTVACLCKIIRLLMYNLCLTIMLLQIYQINMQKYYIFDWSLSRPIIYYRLSSMIITVHTKNVFIYNSSTEVYLGVLNYPPSR